MYIICKYYYPHFTDEVGENEVNETQGPSTSNG